MFSNAYKNYATIGKSITLKDTISASKQNIFTTPKETKLVWFNLIDTIMSGKGNFQLKLKTNSLDDVETQQTVKFKKIEPWHDIQSQYVNDLTNTLNEINKILIKYNSLENPNKNLGNETSINKIKEIYHYLCNFSTYKTVTTLEDQTNFYKFLSFINKLINKINSNLEP